MQIVVVVVVVVVVLEIRYRDEFFDQNFFYQASEIIQTIQILFQFQSGS